MAVMSDTDSRRGVNILMYHSISGEPGPTSIPPATFKAQMETLAECGYQAVSLSDFAEWHGGGSLPARPVVITFDDGFADFAEHAAPVLAAHGWSATVFLPSGRLGGHEDWYGANAAPRPLMSWDQVRALAKDGIDFGGHSVTHADLTALAPDKLEDEVHRCREEIGARLGQAPISFAPPYGHANEGVLATVRKYYRVSVGVRLARAGRGDDVFDLPRIEMHYFRDPARWRAHLEGRGEVYFAARRGLRRVRSLATG